MQSLAAAAACLPVTCSSVAALLLPPYAAQVSALTGLRLLYLHNAFNRNVRVPLAAWSALAPLRRLVFLSISGNQLQQLPPCVAGLTQLQAGAQLRWLEAACNGRLVQRVAAASVTHFMASSLAGCRQFASTLGLTLCCVLILWCWAVWDDAELQPCWLPWLSHSCQPELVGVSVVDVCSACTSKRTSLRRGCRCIPTCATCGSW